MVMTESLTITTERVDDIPLLIAQLERMGLPAVLDAQFPTHGNWAGLSLGWTTAIWLVHILSEADHRMNHVQPWAERHLQTLRATTGQELRPLDLADDRLAAILRQFSNDQRWQACETALAQHLVRVYDLALTRVRLDTTTVTAQHLITEDGLFQLGHSKDHRPDLPQLKLMLATLDPLGLPLLSTVVPGNRADDPLYVPIYDQVRQVVQRTGLLYIGDAKLASNATRATMQAHGDIYLCPLPQLQLPPEGVAAYVRPALAAQQALTPVTRTTAAGVIETIAEGFVIIEELTGTAADGQVHTWHEQRFVVRSHAFATQATASMAQRLVRAEAEIAALAQRGPGKRRPRSLAEARTRASAIMAREQVTGLLRVRGKELIRTQPVRSYNGRPARLREDHQWSLEVERDADAIRQAESEAGWRVYATNAPPEKLDVALAVLAYRDEFVIERCFGRLKGHPLSIRPLYVERDDHATGLVRLLTLAVRLLTLVEYVIRERLAQQGAQVRGLVAGNPTRATARPTTEAVLRAFKELTLTIIHGVGPPVRHLTPLSPVQRQLLDLLDFEECIYACVTTDSG